MKRVLIANIFGIGDVLFTTPIISCLKHEYPECRIDYLCNARTCRMLRNDPMINGVFVYEKDEYAELLKNSVPDFLRRIMRSMKEIKDNRYDTVFDLTLSREFGIFFLLAGIKERIGFDYKGRGMLLTRKISIPCFSGKHVIEHYFDLMKKAGMAPSAAPMRLFVNGEAEVFINRYLTERNVDEKKLVAVVPGGGASWGGHAGRKRWGTAQFGFIGKKLAEEGYQVAILGDSYEKGLCEEVGSAMEGKNVLIENGLDIERYIALINKCRLLICNDGGPLHIGVALGKRTVSVFGPVSPEVYGPYPAGDKHMVFVNPMADCRPCYDRFRLPECSRDMACLTGVDEMAVLTGCREMLKERE